MKILAVCAGNICRSPAAAAAISAAAAEAGVTVEVDSAGTGSWNLGEPPHPDSVAAGSRAGLEITGRARKVHVADFNRFDIIVAMDRSNYRHLADLAPSKEAKAKVRLFRTYEAESTEDQIPDPWGGPIESYEEMMVTVKASARGLIGSLVSA